MDDGGAIVEGESAEDDVLEEGTLDVVGAQRRRQDRNRFMMDLEALLN